MCFSNFYLFLVLVSFWFIQADFPLNPRFRDSMCQELRPLFQVVHFDPFGRFSSSLCERYLFMFAQEAVKNVQLGVVQFHDLQAIIFRTAASNKRVIIRWAIWNRSLIKSSASVRWEHQVLFDKSTADWKLTVSVTSFTSWCHFFCIWSTSASYKEYGPGCLFLQMIQIIFCLASHLL